MWHDDLKAAHARRKETGGDFDETAGPKSRNPKCAKIIFESSEIENFDFAEIHRGLVCDVPRHSPGARDRFRPGEWPGTPYARPL